MNAKSFWALNKQNKSFVWGCFTPYSSVGSILQRICTWYCNYRIQKKIPMHTLRPSGFLGYCEVSKSSIFDPALVLSVLIWRHVIVSSLQYGRWLIGGTNKKSYSRNISSWKCSVIFFSCVEIYVTNLLREYHIINAKYCKTTLIQINYEEKPILIITTEL